MSDKLDGIILIIEDEEVTSKLLQKYLEKYFKTVYTANNGQEGLDLYYKHKPEIIISDIIMPKMNGLDLISKIRKTDTKTRIIVLTAYCDKEQLLFANRLKLDDYLLKPVDLNRLKEAIYLSYDHYFQDCIYLNDNFSWNRKKQHLYDNNKNRIILNNNEMKLLTLLCENNSSYFSKTYIAEHIYFDESRINNVRTLISRLKSKIESNLIESGFEQGYRIKLFNKC